MNIQLTDTERQHLRRLQKQRRDEAGYVKVIADDLGLDGTTVYCYAQGRPESPPVNFRDNVLGIRCKSVFRIKTVVPLTGKAR